MKYPFTLFVIDEPITAFMKKVDVFQPFKYLCRMFDVETTTRVDEKYFQNLIDESWKWWNPKDISSGPRIAAIMFLNNIFFHDEVGIISDGEHELFLDNPKAWENPERKSQYLFVKDGVMTGEERG